jgi:carboxyl-terminal processing protease
MRARSLVCSLLLAASAGALACGGSRPLEPASVPGASEAAPETEPRAALPAYAGAFDHVWKTVRDTHWEPDKVGPAWDAARSELRPQILAARTPDEARAVIGRLLARLGQSHFGIIPGSIYREVASEGGPGPADETASGGGGGGTPGLTTRIVEGELLVVSVDPGSGAARAGVRAGSVIRRVNHREVAEVIGAAGDDHGETLVLLALHQLLSGPVGSTLSLELDTGEAAPSLVQVTLAGPRGTPVEFGNLPGLLVDYQSRAIGRDAALVRLSAFFDPGRVVPAFARDVATFSGRRGLILDLRGNPGGIGAMAMGMGGYLIDRKGASLGTMSTRDSSIKFVLNPQPDPFAGKVAILVDGLCMSTCEIFAGGLQQLGRARVFGLRTAGAALPSVIERLPTGDGFQYAIASYVSADGTPLEGRGVEPDVHIPWDRAALLAGRDPALDAALAWIRQ